MAEEDPTLPPSQPEEPASTQAARIRRRWLTLAEILGLAAVTISGLTLWNNYQQRKSQEAERAAAEAKASAVSRILMLRATPDREGSRLTLAPVDSAQTIQTQTIAFPSALGVDAVETVSDARIEERWFGRALMRAIGDAEGQRGDARIPVAIRTRFFSGSTLLEDVALYDVGYRIEEGGLLAGDRLRLRGLSKVESVAAGRAQARLDALWEARRPAQASEE